MKTKLVKIVRKLVPAGAVHGLEEVYRRARVQLISARYGFPARDMRVIAITGTNGKTTTANYLNEILKAAGYQTAMFTTAVIEIAGQRQINDLNATVPLTGQMQKFLWRAKRSGVDFVVFEATSHAIHQHKLSTIPVECAVMTNLTQDHLDYHATMDEYAAVKAQLFKKAPKYIVLNRDDKWFDYFNQFEAGEQKINYGSELDAECRIDRVKLYRKGSEISLVIDHQTKVDVATALPGKFNVYNLTAAAAVAYLLHVPLQSIADGISNLSGIPGRLERIEQGQSYDVMVDYAHTPDALEQLLQMARELTKNRVILVFGACGDRDKTKRPIMGEIAAKYADRILVTEEESYSEDPGLIRQMVLEGIARAKADAKTQEIPERRDAIAKALSIACKGDIVLVTGMGQEQYRIVNGERVPWNDGEIIRSILASS